MQKEFYKIAKTKDKIYTEDELFNLYQDYEIDDDTQVFSCKEKRWARFDEWFPAEEESTVKTETISISKSTLIEYARNVLIGVLIIFLCLCCLNYTYSSLKIEKVKGSIPSEYNMSLGDRFDYFLINHIGNT